MIRDRVLSEGLLARPPLQAIAAKPLMFAYAALLGVGLIRLVKGIAAGRPVGLLVVSMLLTGAVAWWLLRGMGNEGPTAEGKRVLRDCRSRLGRHGDDPLWMVSLLGRAG